MNSLKPKLYQRCFLSVTAASPSKKEAGFTLIELLVVIVIIGVLAAIAAPGWLGFMRQRRVNATYNVVLQKVQEAKSEARKKKLDYSLSFRLDPNTQRPQVAIHPSSLLYDATGTLKPSPDAAMQSYWSAGTLGPDSDKVLILTNLKAGSNKRNDNNVQSAIIQREDSQVRSITFDDTGVLKNPMGLDGGDPNPLNSTFSIVVASPNGSSLTEAVPGSKRCVMVRTLLGGLTPGRRQYEPTSNPEGCP